MRARSPWTIEAHLPPYAEGDGHLVMQGERVLLFSGDGVLAADRERVWLSEHELTVEQQAEFAHSVIDQWAEQA